MGDTGAHKHKHKKVTNSLVALSSAAVLAVYSAGYQRTKVAADRFERLAASRRHAVPAPAGVARGPATEDAPATATVARGHAIEGATAPPSNPGGVPATRTEPPPTANAAPAEIAPITPPPRGRFKDGTYQGRGSCIHGDIQAQVVVKNGRITEATISSCETRYSCDWLDPILPQVAARQSAFVDYVSGATDSTDAFSAAVTDALLKAE